MAVVSEEASCVYSGNLYVRVKGGGGGREKKKRNNENGWLTVIFTDICVVLDKKMVDVPYVNAFFSMKAA